MSNENEYNNKKRVTRKKRITKINVDPNLYKVKRKVNLIKGKGKDRIKCDGYCDYSTSTIALDKDLSISTDKVILLHESLHAIYNCSSPGGWTKVEEKIVSKLAPGIIRLMRDNKNLVRYLMEEDE